MIPVWVKRNTLTTGGVIRSCYKIRYIHIGIYILYICDKSMSIDLTVFFFYLIGNLLRGKTVTFILYNTKIKWH